MANLTTSYDVASTNLKLYTSTEDLLAEPGIERVFKGYFKENPLHKMIDMADSEEHGEERIEVEYLHGYYCD